MNTKWNYCLVCFEDSNDALVACQRSHVVDNCTLQLQVFYDCLGIPAGDEESQFQSLSPITIDNLDQLKVTFLLNSKTNKRTLEKQLLAGYGKIIWPTGDSNQLKIECTLNKDMTDFRRLAKYWENNARKTISEIVDVLVIEEHSTVQEAWQSVMEKLKEVYIANPNDVAVKVEKPNCKIYIVGQKAAVKEVFDKVKVIIDEVIYQLDRTKQQMKEKIYLKRHQLGILALTHFPNKVQKKFLNSEVTIDMDNNVLVFNGISDDITAAKLSMYETVNAIVSANIGTRSRNFIQFLKSSAVKNYVDLKLKENNVIGVWDIQDNNITMYSMSDAEVGEAAEIFRETVIETIVTVDSLKQTLLHSSKWTQYINDIEDDCKLKSIVAKIEVNNQGQIIILCTGNEGAGMIKETIQEFCLSNTEQEDWLLAGRDIRHISTAAASTNETNVFTIASGQKVIIVQGDITELNVDVTVNAANKDLEHGGGLAKVIINKGGKSIKAECRSHIKTNGQMSEGEIFCSGPGRLKCKVIIHMVGPSWQNKSSNNEQRLGKCVDILLQETENRSFKSIAFPALCTGIFGYPADEATKVIAETVRDYFNQNKSSTIQTVYLCDIVDKTVNLFGKAGNKFFSKTQARLCKIPDKGLEQKISGTSSNIENIGNIKVKVIKGELAKMRVDAIVNTTSKDLLLSKGAISASLSKESGLTLLQECLQKYPNGIQYGDVAVISGGNLSCQIVCHGSLDQWQQHGSSINMLKKLINGCLSTADQMKCTSIAFPAMGTGNLGYPKDVVAKTMFSCVIEYSVQNPGSNIIEVLFVLYDKDYRTIQVFEDAQKKRQGGLNSHHKITVTANTTSHQFSGEANDRKQLKPQKAAGEQDIRIDDKIFSISIGKLIFKVYQGDITSAKVDVIVNGSNTDLDLSLENVMKRDGIAVTELTKHSSNGLQCDVVFHIDMTIMNKGVQACMYSYFNLSPTLKDKVRQALDKAEELKKSTIAFPALGTAGAIKIPVSQAAVEIVKAVEEFTKAQNQYVQEVHVIIYQKDMMMDFIKAIKKYG